MVFVFRFVQISTLQETRVLLRVQAVFDAPKEALAVVFVILHCNDDEWTNSYISVLKQDNNLS